MSVYIDKKIVSETTYQIAAGTSAFITTIENVPEDSKYKLLISVKNTLNEKEANGKFVKKANCIKDGDDTTTTIPPLTTTTTISPTTTTDIDIDVEVGLTTTSTTTTTIPPPTTTIFVDPDEGDPLTAEEGNDIYIWDFEEDIYFTDGDFIVTYLYQENNIIMADTGITLNYINYQQIDLEYIYLGSGISFIFFLGFLIRYRKRKLLNKITPLQKVYENASMLKNEIESMVKSKVKISIDIAEQYNPATKSAGEYINSISSLVKELEYTIVAVKNINKKNIFKDIEQNKVIEILKENLELINDGGFDFTFTKEPISEKNKVIDFEERKSRKNIFLKKKKHTGGMVAAMFFLISLGIGYLGFQQSYLTNSIQFQAQEKFEKIFTNESPVGEIYERKAKLSYDLVSYEEPAGIFPELREIFSLKNRNSNTNYDTSLFGFLEIPEIKLQQYVVIGTSEVDLQLGPGYYLGTEIPGSGGNVGIAGHRTTYGAPFSELHQVNIGDEISLTFGPNKYTYIVDQIHIVPARGGEYLLYNNGVDRLTLTTCHPKYSGKERLVVSGVLKKIESGV